jgi:hypothetical protein
MIRGVTSSAFVPVAASSPLSELEVGMEKGETRTYKLVRFFMLGPFTIFASPRRLTRKPCTTLRGKLGGSQGPAVEFVDVILMTWPYAPRTSHNHPLPIPRI